MLPVFYVSGIQITTVKTNFNFFQESVMELHDKLIMEIQVLSQENNSLRKNGFKKDEDQK